MATDKTASFGIKVDAQTNAETAAASVEQLRDQISAAQKSVKSYSENLRLLRGSSDEVKAAKDALKGAVNAEREAISRAVLALGKQGVAYDSSAKKAKGAAEASKGLGGALKVIGGPAEAVKGRLEELRGVIGGVGTAFGAAAVGGAVFLAGLAAVTAGVISGTLAFARFVLEQGNALRTQGLFREAALGSADDARRFGNQIEETARKLPTSRAELNELAVSLSKAYIGARMSGQGIVDTFNAVATSSAAMGKETGSRIEDVILRFKRWGRIGLNPQELIGTGITFRDVSAQLAKDLGVGLDKAQLALLQGRANIDAGAAAIREVVEKRFGAVNAKRLLDINIIVEKFHDNLAGLTKDVNLEPVLAVIDRLAQNFSVATVSGQALKTIIEGAAKLLGKGFTDSEPILQQLFDKGIIYALKFEIGIYEIILKMREWKKEGLDLIEVVKSLAGQLANIVPGIAQVRAALAVKAGAEALYNAAGGGVERDDNGKAVGDGLVSGIEGYAPVVKRAAVKTAGAADEGVRERLQIHSPSAVMREMGRQSGAGFAGGLDDARGKVQDSSERLTGPMLTAPRSAGGGASTTVQTGDKTVHLHFEFPNVKDGAELRKTIASDEFRTRVTAVLLDMFQMSGIPTRTPQATVT